VRSSDATAYDVALLCSLLHFAEPAAVWIVGFM